VRDKKIRNNTTLKGWPLEDPVSMRQRGGKQMSIPDSVNKDPKADYFVN
jgi:hypothetical protein